MDMLVKMIQQHSDHMILNEEEHPEKAHLLQSPTVPLVPETQAQI